MPLTKEKGRLAEGSPIPNYVLADKSEYTALQLQLQVNRLTCRCGVTAGMAETLAPMVFGATLDAASGGPFSWLPAFATLSAGGLLWAYAARKCATPPMRETS